MAWIQTHQSLVSHRKTLTLADELGTSVPSAIGHLVCLWTWALDNAASGDLSTVRPKTIASAALWRRRPDDFISAMLAAGFLDGGPDEPLRLHDWDDYAGRLMQQRERNRRNVQAHRNRVRNDDVSVTSPSRVEKSREEYRTKDDLPLTPASAVVRAERARRGSKRKRDVIALKEAQAKLPPDERYLGKYAAAARSRR
jgi:hypothetical protein